MRNDKQQSERMANLEKQQSDRMTNLENQMSQLIQILSAKEANSSGKLPSQTLENPTKENVSAVTLRSGKELVVTNQKDDEEIMDEEIEIVEEEDGQTTVRRPQHPCGGRRQGRHSCGAHRRRSHRQFRSWYVLLPSFFFSPSFSSFFFFSPFFSFTYADSKAHSAFSGSPKGYTKV